MFCQRCYLDLYFQEMGWRVSFNCRLQMARNAWLIAVMGICQFWRIFQSVMKVMGGDPASRSVLDRSGKGDNQQEFPLSPQQQPIHTRCLREPHIPCHTAKSSTARRSQAKTICLGSNSFTAPSQSSQFLHRHSRRSRSSRSYS